MSIQRPLRLQRYRPSKFIQPVFYLSRRLILAFVCVYMQSNQAGQWLIWFLLSLAQLFVLAKLEPFGDYCMNWVCFINEIFIFVALTMLMPLANNLYDLVARDNIGWVLYAVLVLCILFNIIILLLRSLSLLCSYFSARNEIFKKV